MSEPPLTYEQLYRNLDGVTALLTAESTSLEKLPDERDTAFVKRIVATFMAFEAKRFWIKSQSAAANRSQQNQIVRR